jgi:hypothetical protein
LGILYEDEPLLPATSQHLHAEEDLDQRPVRGFPGPHPDPVLNQDCQDVLIQELDSLDSVQDLGGDRENLERGVDLGGDLQLEFDGGILPTVNSHRTTHTSSLTSSTTSPIIPNHRGNLDPRFRGDVLTSAASSTTGHSTLSSPPQLSKFALSPLSATTSPAESPLTFSCDQCGKSFLKRYLLKYVATNRITPLPSFRSG